MLCLCPVLHSVYLVCLQGPLPNTCGHFWEMVWEQKSRGVVMLNRIMEKGSVSSCRNPLPLLSTYTQPGKRPVPCGPVFLFSSSFT